MVLILSVAYTLLFILVIGYAAALDAPDWWYPTFGEYNISAIAWM
ncbi:MAG: hypothetical protein V7701_14895 [Sneathiella sp.]